MNDETDLKQKLYLTIFPLKKSKISEELGGENLMQWRYYLHTRKQTDDESFNNFYEDLLSLVKLCKFKDDSILRDHVVFGIKDCGIREQLLAHDNPSLETVLEICRNKENEPCTGDTENLGEEGEGCSHLEDQNTTNKQQIKFEDEEYLEDWDNEFSDTSSTFTEIMCEPPVKSKLDVYDASAKFSADSNACQTKMQKGRIPRGCLSTAVGAQQQSTSSSTAQKLHTEDATRGQSSEISSSTSHLERISAIKRIVTGQSARVLYNCVVCGRKFKQKHHLSEHISIHTKVMPNCYEGSSKSFPRNEPLTQNSLSHSDQKPHCCEICNKCFDRKELLSQHILIHSDQKPHCCEICNLSFNRKELLSEHTLLHTKKKIHSCGVCNKSFGRKEILSRHMFTHTKQKPHRCDVCKLNFSLKLTLSRHMLIHTGQKPHSCEVCNKRFARASTLSEHMLIHTKQKPQFCNICRKTFAKKSTLSQHMLTHTQEKSHSCEICRRCFSRKEPLLRHMLIHTKQKPHCCNVCSKSFAQIGTLSRHMLTHNKRSG